jgi:hypothetical protein
MLEQFHAGVVEAAKAPASAGTSGFDLTTVLASFGASVPLFLWLLKMHRDLISIVIPRGFRLIRREMRRQGLESQKRHSEHIELMRAVTKTARRKRPRGKLPIPHSPPAAVTGDAASAKKRRQRRGKRRP